MGVVSQNNCFTFYLRYILCYLWDKTIYDFRGAEQCTFSLAQDAYLWVVVADCNGASEGLETMRPRLLFLRRNSGSSRTWHYMIINVSEYVRILESITEWIYFYQSGYIYLTSIFMLCKHFLRECTCQNAIFPTSSPDRYSTLHSLLLYPLDSHHKIQ